MKVFIIILILHQVYAQLILVNQTFDQPKHITIVNLYSNYFLPIEGSLVSINPPTGCHIPNDQ
jgi:hypothetical protein